MATVNVASYSWLSFFILPLAMVSGITTNLDLVLLMGFLLLRNRDIVFRIVLDLKLIPIVSLGASITIARGFLKTRETYETRRPTEGDWLKPMLFPCRTSHTRFFPKSHSFSYSYLLAGIPVGWRGSVSGLLAADGGNNGPGGSNKVSGNSWYTVDAGDYLDRGNGHLGLDGKLKRFLQNHYIRHEDYPYAYFMTAPKFLGYSFNPVSFWYLYSAEEKLTAMILEVNNTFDERHMYFLKSAEDTVDTVTATEEAEINLKELPLQDDIAAITGFPSPKGLPTKFTNSWSKEFHVSPFNSRKGSYSLVAYDPLHSLELSRIAVNNTITLKSSKAHSKLVARIFSTGPAVDPSNMTTWKSFKFLASWWWVGFVTFPRIVREAGKLFFRRKLHVWFRPEPLKNSMGRHADETERALELVFRDYLRHTVECASSPIVVKYLAAGIPGASEETMMSLSASEHPENVETLEIRVLTPVFYSRFVHYAHDSEAFFSEFFENSTIWLSKPEMLPKIATKRPMPVQELSNWTNFILYKSIQRLRHRPIPIEGPKVGKPMSKNCATQKVDIRKFRLSAMDGFILSHGTSAEQSLYCTAVLKIFISDWIAFGNTDILWVEGLLARCLIVWSLAGALTSIVADG